MQTATKIIVGVATLGFVYVITHVFTQKKAPAILPQIPGTPTTPVKSEVVAAPTKVAPVKQPDFGNQVFWNAKADATQVNLYKSVTDYPGKPYLTLPPGKKNRKGMQYLGFQGYKYPNSNVVITLYLVQLPNVSHTTYVPAQYLSPNANS